ncbi:MAG: hypothetical protein IJF20_08385 [Clostridia bacterium]|nr:hypothetical protein [Clostridia bacterium]
MCDGIGKWRKIRHLLQKYIQLGNLQNSVPCSKSHRGRKYNHSHQQRVKKL